MHKSFVYLGLISAMIAFIIYHSANAEQDQGRRTFSTVARI